MRWSRAALLAALFALSACTSSVQGKALFDPLVMPPPPKPGDSAAELIGNANSVDACSMLDPAALAQFGATQQPPQESYDYCWLKLPMSGATVAVRFGLLERIKSVGQLQAKEVEPVRSLRVFEEGPVPDRCARYIVFSDNVTLAVSADSRDSPGAKVAELCSVAEKATTAIAEHVVGKKLKHRQYEPASLGRLDACKAVTTTLGQVPGLAAGEVTSYPARHQCRWGSATMPSVTVRYVLDEPSTKPEVKRETIAGKDTGIYNVAVTGRSLCVAEVKQGSGRELAQIAVRLPPNNDMAACAAARVIAGEVWGKLPATS
jgi:hypothetical protein